MSGTITWRFHIVFEYYPGIYFRLEIYIGTHAIDAITGTRAYNGTGIARIERGTYHGVLAGISKLRPHVPLGTAHESLEMTPNAAARCSVSDTSST